LLQATLDAYLKALAAHDPSSLSLAENVKFTENSKASKLGEAGLWKTAGAVKYSQSALDTEACSTASHLVIPDGTKDIPVALRLKLQGDKLVEVEMIAARSGDYSVASNTDAMIKMNDTVKWETPVPAAERDTRETLTGWMDKYFRMFPNGVCNTDSKCVRLENGGGNYKCSEGAGCSKDAPSGTPKSNPRLILADTERGIGVGFTVLLGSTDMHLFKMYGGKVYAVHALLSKASSSGWE
jgi:hypothetical protein